MREGILESKVLGESYGEQILGVVRFDIPFHEHDVMKFLLGGKSEEVNENEKAQKNTPFV